jgi:CheY-like chemotaxis protein
MILHAEDDENDGFLFKLALKKAGVSNPLMQVPDGEDAVEYLAGSGPYADRQKYPLPCLLVTDLKMPRVSGFELLADIKELLASRQIRAIVLTASVADSDKQRCLALGAEGYFVKPIGLPAFIALAAELKKSWIPSLSQPA